MGVINELESKYECIKCASIMTNINFVYNQIYNTNCYIDPIELEFIQSIYDVFITKNIKCENKIEILSYINMLAAEYCNNINISNCCE